MNANNVTIDGYPEVVLRPGDVLTAKVRDGKWELTVERGREKNDFGPLNPNYPIFEEKDCKWMKTKK